MLGLGGLGRHGGWAGGWAGGVGPAGGVLTEGRGSPWGGGPWVLAAGGGSLETGALEGGLEGERIGAEGV